MSKPRFVCVARSMELIAPKEEGKEPSVGVKMLVVEGPAEGTEKFWYGSLTGGAAEFTIQALRTMGWTGTDLTDPAGIGSVKFAAVEETKTLPAQGNRPPKKITQYQIWPAEGRARLDEDEGKAMANRFKALAAAAPVIKVTDGNKAPDKLPEVRATQGNGASAAVDGPALSGTQF